MSDHNATCARPGCVRADGGSHNPEACRIRTADDGWRGKAQRLIADICRPAAHYRSGKRKPRYVIPADAEFLVRCLDTNDEHGAKDYFHRHAFGLTDAQNGGAS